VKKNPLAKWVEGWPSAILTALLLAIIGVASGRLQSSTVDKLAALWFELALAPHWAYIGLWTVTLYVSLLAAKQLQALGRSRLLVAAITALAGYAALTALASGAIGRPPLTPAALAANIIIIAVLISISAPRKAATPPPNWKRAGEPLVPEVKNPRKTFED
jgi:hypothetical protein